MNRFNATKIALTIFAAGSMGCAFAEGEMKISGQIAAGVTAINNIGASGETLTRMSMGENATGLVAITGSRPLSGDVTGSFHLEHGFTALAANTNGGAGKVFDRGASLSLSSPVWGSVEIGRQWQMTGDVWMSDPLTMAGNWSGVDTLSQGRHWQFLDNVVSYRAPKMGGLALGVQQVLGGASGGTDSKNVRGTTLSASYTTGDLMLQAIYDASPDKNGKYSYLTYQGGNEFGSKNTILGATYQLGAVKLFVGTEQISAPDAAPGSKNTLNHNWLGVNYKSSKNLTLKAAYYQNKISGGVTPNDAESKLLVFAADYAINGYATWTGMIGQVSNNQFANAPVIGYWDSLPASGNSQTAISTGIVLRF